MKPKQAWAIAMVATIAIAPLLTSCAIQDSGPLRGPREGGEASTVCAPAQTSARLYFGSPYSNLGDQPITIRQVEATGTTNVTRVEFGFDHEGHHIGAAADPAASGSVDIGPMLKTLRSGPGDIVTPGEEVTLVLSLIPELVSRDAVLDRIEITYTVGGITFREADNTTFRLAPATCK